MELGIGLIGTGTIGSGVIEILRNNADTITRRTGTKVILKKVVLRKKERAKELGLDESVIVSDYKDLINDKGINIVVELIGGYEPARTIILDAIRAKKHVVTANKAVLAKHGKEIFDEAKKYNVIVNFEGAVAGCIPIIKVIRESYASDNIKAIYGILNGTTNYILTRMEEGMEYSDALKKAQELGFAEADSAFDVEGNDAAQKLVILSRLAYNSMIPENITTFGITKLKMADFKYAKQLGYKIKLLTISKLIKKELDIRVMPVLIPIGHGLAGIKNEINAVSLSSENSKETLFVGRGAGKLPTATVVVSDIMEIAKEKKDNFYFENPIALKNTDDILSRFYLRVMMIDRPGTLAQVAKILGEHNISINGVLQNEEDTEIIPVVITTHMAKRKDIVDAIAKMVELDVVKERPIYMMIEDI